MIFEAAALVCLSSLLPVFSLSELSEVLFDRWLSPAATLYQISFRKLSQLLSGGPKVTPHLQAEHKPQQVIPFPWFGLVVCFSSSQRLKMSHRFDLIFKAHFWKKGFGVF